MLTYIFRKIAYSLIVLLGVMSVTFVINFVLPGDPARLMLGQRADLSSVEALRQQMGLDRPLYEQYVRFLGRVTKGDLGRSFATNREVTEEILDRLPATALLAFSAMGIAIIGGVLIGIISAVRSGTFLDGASMSVALLGISVPSYIMGLLLIIIFSVTMKWFPISGYVNRGWEYLILPMITLGIRPLSIIARVTRSSMLEVLEQDYIRTAKAKGVSPRKVIFRHALRNALNPVITTISSWFAVLLAGTFFVEYIFNWPGIGTIAIGAIEKLDYPLIQGTVLFTAVVFVIVNVIVDIAYAFLDPKVKLY